MPPPKRGQASFAKKKVEVDPEEEKRKKAEYDAAQKKKRLEAAKRFSVGGTVDLAEFMDDDPDMSVTAKLQQVMSTAKESGLKVQQIFSYFKPNGKLEGDITPEDFGAAMHKLGWKCTDEQLKTLLDDFDEDGNGVVTKQELVKILKANHMATHDREVMRKADTIMAQADKDGDGVVDFDEFVIISKKFPNILFPAFAMSEKIKNKF